ncbi:MAG: peptide-methionine (S)-S-oxide reductase MsrA [Candidatus Doudnabacteria bacterium]|nr:peptide-methionine (S)-S-oxide reductase MsrA [Candidatus Doudnabacteria bacterium]
MTETAVFAGGCFWCLEAVFQQVKGVEKVVSGYAGGGTGDAPTYEQVGMGRVHHAECVQLTFDPVVVTYETLLDIFFTIHDPTTLNRQGNDVGEQYRSAVFYVTEEQRKWAEQKITELVASGEFSDPLVTQVQALDRFYTAEEYHQNYYQENKQQPYCQLVISPKIKKFHEKFKELLKSEYQ